MRSLFRPRDSAPYRAAGAQEPKRFRSIQATIALTLFSLVFIVILVIELVSYNLTAETVRSNSEAYTLQLVKEVSSSVDSYVRYMKNISSVILYDQDVQRYFGSAPGGPASSPRVAAAITDLLSSVKRARQDISLVALFSPDGRVIADRPNLAWNPYIHFKSLEWYKAALRAQGAPVVSSSHVQDLIANEYRWVISLSRAITNPTTGKTIAVLLVDLNYRVIRDMCSSIDLGSRGYAFVIGRHGDIIYHPQQQLIYSNLKKERINEVVTASGSSFLAGTGVDRRIYTIHVSKETGWRIVGVTYMSTLVSDKEFIQFYYLLLGVACIAVIIVLSILISFRISKPIKTLIRSMDQVERGNFEIKVNIPSYDEIGSLGRKFNIMVAKIRELMIQNVREQELKRKFELQALQAQINPHFLYNTLDSIIWMAESRRHEEVVMMVSSLAKLFRLTISRGDEIVPIETEIEHITHYLIIQKMRYRDRLDFEIDVPTELFPYQTVKLLLQPLVENSIYHGIKNRRGRGVVRIAARKEEERILLQVIDNGVGMARARVARLLDPACPDAKSGGVGVRNVDERIKLHFGEGFGLTFESTRYVGTTVNVWLPAILAAVQQ